MTGPKGLADAQQRMLTLPLLSIITTDAGKCLT